MIFINSRDEYNNGVDERLLESVDNGTYFDDMIESLDLEESSFNLISELCQENLTNEKYVALNELNLKNVGVSIKTFFKVLIAKVIEFFRNMGNKADRCQKQVREFLKNNEEKLKPFMGKTYTISEEYPIITDLSPFKNIINNGTEKWRNFVEKSNSENKSIMIVSDKNDGETLRVACKLMIGLNVDTSRKDVGMEIVKQISTITNEVKISDMYNFLKFVASDEFTKFNSIDKKILSFTKQIEGECEKLINNNPGSKNIENKELNLKKRTCVLSTNITLKVVRLLMSIAIYYANKYMAVFNKMVSRIDENK